MDEAFAVAASRGTRISESDKALIVAKIDYFKTEGRNARTSLLLDVENQRRTEIETLHGTLVRYARETGVKTPLLETVYAIVQVHEARIAALPR
jgi:ketopantoate reductase